MNCTGLNSWARHWEWIGHLLNLRDMGEMELETNLTMDTNEMFQMSMFNGVITVSA
jgi:hypothetical protein